MAKNPETDLYFYHPDHLSSSSWITDIRGRAIQHLQYLPFGETRVDQRTTSWNTMYSFSTKEKDEESGYGYFGARYYDSDLSIWLSVDPMAGKYPGLSPYNYCANNPIRWIDPDGRAPGDPFKTKIDAANDFALYYNGTSIKMSREFASTLYTNSDGTYSYNVAYIGSEDGVRINHNIPENTTKEGVIHSHGSEDPGYDNNNFSPADKSYFDKSGQNGYVVTPSGELKEYDVSTKTSSVPTGASNDIPSDPNSGSSRVNKVDATDTKPKYIDPVTKTTYNE